MSVTAIAPADVIILFAPLMMILVVLFAHVVHHWDDHDERKTES